MTAVESLVELGHRPERTIVMAFGFDEESAGTQGAGMLAPALEEQFGPNSMELIVRSGRSSQAEQRRSTRARALCSTLASTRACAPGLIFADVPQRVSSNPAIAD